MGPLSGHRDAGSCVCASVEEKGGMQTPLLRFPCRHWKKGNFFTLEGKHPRLLCPNSRVVPSQELLPLATNKTWIIWLPSLDFASNPVGKGCLAAWGCRNKLTPLL